MHYLSGEEIILGDRVQYKGTVATVVFISDGTGGEFAPGYADYAGYEPGLMIADDDGDTTFIRDPDEYLDFLSH